MILLSFNIINNRPETTSGSLLSEEALLEITLHNTSAILRILEIQAIKATFFIDISLVKNLERLIRKINSYGHEISLFNDGKNLDQIKEATDFAESLTGKTIRGIRQKKADFDLEMIKQLEFNYVSEAESTTVFFPLKRLERSTEIKETGGISIIPESISPYGQIPYNSLAFQWIPLPFYKNMVTETLKSEDFVMIYLDTYQFTEANKASLKIPFFKKINSGKKLEDKLENFLQWINDFEHATARIKDYIF